jgi:hypothetical protein
MKKYLIYKNGRIFCVVLQEGLPEGELVKELSENESSLELRYAVEDNQFVDKFLGKTDEEVLAAIANASSEESFLAITEVSPVEFKLLFTPQERIALRAAKVKDFVLQDFFDIAEDPRLTKIHLKLESTIMAINYMVMKGFLTAERGDQIKAGKPLS